MSVMDEYNEEDEEMECLYGIWPDYGEIHIPIADNLPVSLCGQLFSQDDVGIYLSEDYDLLDADFCYKCALQFTANKA